MSGSEIHALHHLRALPSCNATESPTASPPVTLVGGMEAGWEGSGAKGPMAGSEAPVTLSAAELVEELCGRTETAEGKVSPGAG